MNVELVAEHVQKRTWIVRPSGQLGTHGSWPYLWAAEYVTAASGEQALRKATSASAAFERWRNSDCTV